MRVLVTGAAGRVGSTVARGLKDRHDEVRGHDRVPMPDLTDTVVSDLTDFDSMLEATRDVDAVAHIGGLPGGNEWETMLQSNFIGTYNVFEAARQNGVKRVAYASRAGVLTLYPRSIHRTVDMTTTPVGIYTVKQGFRRGAGPLLLPDQHDMEFVCGCASATSASTATSLNTRTISATAIACGFLSRR